MRKLLLSLLLILGLCAPSSALAAIALDMATTASTDPYDPHTTLTKSLTISSGSDRMLFVYSENKASATCTSATFNGVSMTEIADTSYNQNACAYYLVAPATGTHDLVITYSTSIGANVSISSFTGVKQDVPDDTDTATGNGSTSMTLTAAANDSWIIDGISNYGNAGTLTPGGSQTKDATLQNPGTTAVGHKVIASAGNGTVTWSDGEGYEMIGIGMVVSPATTSDCNTDCSLCTSPDVPRACIASTKPCYYTIESGCSATAPTYKTEIK